MVNSQFNKTHSVHHILQLCGYKHMNLPFTWYSPASIYLFLLSKKINSSLQRSVNSVCKHVYSLLCLWSSWSGINYNLAWKISWKPFIAKCFQSHSLSNFVWLPGFSILSAHWAPSPLPPLLCRLLYSSLSGKMPERCSRHHTPLPALVIWQRTERVKNNWNSIYASVWRWQRERNI